MRIMSLAFIQILRLSQHPCPTLVLLPSLMLHLLHIIDNMVDLSILLGLLPFFVHGKTRDIGAPLGRYSSRNEQIVVEELCAVFLVWLRTVICGHTKA